jgi:hypothetical protein
MRPTKFNRAWIMVSLDPNPSTASLKARDPIRLVFGQAPCRICILETIAKANDCLCIRLGNIAFQTKKRVACFIRGQVQMIAPRKGLGFSKMEIGNA